MLARKKRSWKPAGPEKRRWGARTLLEAQLGSSHQQMQMFNQRMAQIVRVSGGLIRWRPCWRCCWHGAKPLFYSLAAGETLYRAESGGGADWSGPDRGDHSGLGRDELGRIAGLLRHTGQQCAKTAAGTGDWRAKAIEADLRHAGRADPDR